MKLIEEIGFIDRGMGRMSVIICGERINCDRLIPPEDGDETHRTLQGGFHIILREDNVWEIRVLDQDLDNPVIFAGDAMSDGWYRGFHSWQEFIDFYKETKARLNAQR